MISVSTAECWMETSLTSCYTVVSWVISPWSAALAPQSRSCLVSCPRWYPMVAPHSLSLHQQFGSCCLVVTPSTTLHKLDRKDEGKCEEKKEPPVTGSIWFCMPARFNLLHYWFPKPNNCSAMAFSRPSPAETRIERWPDDALTSWCVCVCVSPFQDVLYRPCLGGKQLLGDDWHPAPHLFPPHFLSTNQ